MINGRSSRGCGLSYANGITFAEATCENCDVVLDDPLSKLARQLLTDNINAIRNGDDAESESIR